MADGEGEDSEGHVSRGRCGTQAEGAGLYKNDGEQQGEIFPPFGKSE